MPSSESSRWDEDSSTDLSSPSDRVNDPPSFSGGKKSGAILRFTPHFSLIPFVPSLRMGMVDTAVLTQMLWWASKRGQGAGCYPDEGMFWRKLASIAEAVGCSERAVDDALKRLRKTGFVRSRIVRALQRLPSGARALAPVCVVYVNVDRIRQRAGLSVGTNEARERTSCAVDGANGALSGPEKPAENEASGRPARSSLTVNYLKDLTITTPSGTPPARPEPVVMIGDDVVGRVVRRWWERVGRLRIGGDEPRGAVVSQVGRAVSKALASSWTENDLNDTIDGRADRRLGGAAFDYCESKTCGVWGANLFGGCVAHFVRVVRAARSRAEQKKNLERRAESRADLEVSSPPARAAADPGLRQLFEGMAPRFASGVVDASPVDVRPASDVELVDALDALDAELRSKPRATNER